MGPVPPSCTRVQLYAFIARASGTVYHATSSEAPASASSSITSVTALSTWSAKSVAASCHSATTCTCGSYSRSDGSWVAKCLTPKPESQRRSPSREIVEIPIHRVSPCVAYADDATSEQKSADGSV